MKKNKCDNCLIGAYYPPYEIEYVYEDDIDFADISEYFNYCPYCRS